MIYNILSEGGGLIKIIHNFQCPTQNSVTTLINETFSLTVEGLFHTPPVIIFFITNLETVDVSTENISTD